VLRACLSRLGAAALRDIQHIIFISFYCERKGKKCIYVNKKHEAFIHTLELQISTYTSSVRSRGNGRKKKI
jgi:hypothetical protein